MTAAPNRRAARRKTASEERVFRGIADQGLASGACKILAREMEAADEEREILTLRAEFEADHERLIRLRPQWEALKLAFRPILRENGLDAAAECEKNSGWGSVNDENNRLGARTTHLVERMIELQPRTRAGIAAVAACFKADQDCFRKDPEPDRDCEISLLTWFIDGLIECGPPAKTEEVQS